MDEADEGASAAGSDVNTVVFVSKQTGVSPRAATH